MENKKKAIVYFNQLSENPQADELDVLEQADMVEDALNQLGYHVIKLPFSFDLLRAVGEIRKLKPDLIFNLVESIDNNGEFCYFAPAIFNHLQVPYSGVRLEAMFNTTNKMLAKELFIMLQSLEGQKARRYCHWPKCSSLISLRASQRSWDTRPSGRKTALNTKIPAAHTSIRMKISPFATNWKRSH
jgi:hypothetical protein